MKKLLALILLAALLLSACGTNPAPAGETIPVGDSGVIDFVTSAFKHITNGGVTEDENLPYNIDAITGATMTVEGPAIVTSIPLSVRELENRSEGFFRGIYTDSKGTFAYEGMDLYYLLHNMTEGDNGIKMTDTAYKVVLKSSSRLDVAQFTLENAHTLSQIEAYVKEDRLEEILVKTEDMFELVSVRVAPPFEKLLWNGNPIYCNQLVEKIRIGDKEQVKVYAKDKFCAIYECDEAKNMLKPVKMFLE